MVMHESALTVRSGLSEASPEGFFVFLSVLRGYRS